MRSVAFFCQRQILVTRYITYLFIVTTPIKEIIIWSNIIAVIILHQPLFLDTTFHSFFYYYYLPRISNAPVAIFLCFPFFFFFVIFFTPFIRMTRLASIVLVSWARMFRIMIVSSSRRMFYLIQRHLWSFWNNRYDTLINDSSQW